MNREEEIKKEIEECEKSIYLKETCDFHRIKNADLRRQIDKFQAELKGINEGKQERDKEIEDEIDLLDIELFLEDIVDAKTGKKVKLPKEIWDLWFIYWEHIKEKLKSRLKSGEKGE